MGLAAGSAGQQHVAFGCAFVSSGIWPAWQSFACGSVGRSADKVAAGISTNSCLHINSAGAEVCIPGDCNSGHLAGAHQKETGVGLSRKAMLANEPC